MSGSDPAARRLELATAVLLAVAAVATAWSSYQATRWNGEQAKAASQTNALRIDAASAAGLAETETEVDVVVFTEWVDAHLSGADELEAFYEQRFRDEFRPAFEAWLALDPFTDPDAPATPFALPAYRSEQRAEAEDLDRQAEASAATVREDIQRAGNYVLGVVLFAVALFFAGISTKLEGPRVRWGLLAVGWLVFLGALAWIATFPVSISV